MRIALSILLSLLSLNLVFVAASNPDDDNDFIHVASSSTKLRKEPLNLYGKSAKDRSPRSLAPTAITEPGSEAAFWDKPKKRQYKITMDGKPLVHRFKIGPRMGSLNSDSVRIWGMAAPYESQTHKLLGVLRYKKNIKGHQYSAPLFFPILAQHAGIYDLAGLEEGGSYKYQTGWVIVPKQGKFDEKELHWGYKSKHKKKTNNTQGYSLRGTLHMISIDPQPVHFVFSSCNYQNHKDPTAALTAQGINGIIHRRGAETIGLLEKFLTASKISKIDGIVHLGDFVYVDYLNVISGATTWDEIHALYKEILTRPELHRFLKNCPLIATLDDHELENDFTADSLKNLSERAKNALQAYKIFQSMLSPSYDPARDQSDHFWYKTNIGGLPIFMLDLRTERLPSKKELMSEEQFESLKTFLLANKDLPIQFVGSSVPFAPDFDPKKFPASYADKWSGYPKYRNQLLDLLRENNIYNVVFLNGDVHFSAMAEITSDDDAKFKVLSLTSSPWFWPVYFEGESFQKNHIIDATPKSGVPNRYNADLVSPQIERNNFTYIEVNAERTLMKVQIVAEKDSNIFSRLWKRLWGAYVAEPDVIFQKTFALPSPAKKDAPSSDKVQTSSDKADAAAK